MAASQQAVPMRHTVTVQIPCPDETTAKTIQQVLWVDRELRPQDVIKTAKVQSNGALEVHIQATTLRHLRLSLNAFLEDTALIVRTMDAFRTSREDAVGTTDNDGPLEQGSVGRAG
ncbi:low-specificity L-threonine aldolase [Malassezia equina]|uniref:Low-specificity L-threonine aldolase n=1 Tax=Malassezia equina TaxID=1381935 RepID=A0AAF0EFI8_9BASI|nr:low-specificity L-threonine aldolase [Malassezia equina]